jgi:hypothetical protein
VIESHTEWFRAAPGTNWAVVLSRPARAGEVVAAFFDLDGYPCAVHARVSDTDPEVVNVHTVSGLEVEGSFCVTYRPAAPSQIAPETPGFCQTPAVRSA